MRIVPATIDSTIWWAVFAGWVSVLSVMAFAMHAFDKQAAIRGRRRIPEARLHLVEILGGWPGALLAMTLLRHKVRKGPYVFAFLAIVGLWIVSFIAITMTART
jgi:uncharacterized membrane protein YsdA (DUF1294 family)